MPMRFRKTLLFPIITLFVIVAITTLLIGYWISLANLQRSLEAREEDRVYGIHFIIKAIIDTEITRLSAVSSLLRKNRDLAEALSAYAISKNKASLKRLMDGLHEGLSIDYLVVTDSKGMNLYSSKNVETRSDLTDMWGMDEALEGKEITSTDKGSMGFVVSIIGPVYHGNNLKGTIITGLMLGHEFTERLAVDTGSKIFLGTSYGVIASSVPIDQSYPIDKDLVKNSLLDKKSTIIFNRKKETVRLYAPVAVVDTHFCLVVDTDASRMYLLLKQSRLRLLLYSAGVFFLMVALGSIVAIRLIWPLKSLRNRAESVIKDYSGEVQVEVRPGNEVDTLIHAFDSMVDTVRNHIAETNSANEQLEKAREELENRVRERTVKLTKTNDELIRAEETARENERWLQTILESLQIGVMLVDVYTREIVYANKAACGLISITMQDLIGLVCHKHVCPAEVGRCPISDLGQKVDNAERVLIAANGSQIPIIKNVVPVSFKGQDLLLESFIDISGRKKLEEAMKAAKESAESANRAKSRFLASISHEIRTPMNGVLGFMRLLEEDAITEKQRRYVRMALTSGENLLNIINDILDVSKIEAGRLALTPIDFDLTVLVEEVVGFFIEHARQKGLELFSRIASEGPLLLRGDLHRLRQIMVNLIGNAIKFTEHGAIVIMVKTEEEESGSVLLACSVTDTGIGIHPDMQRTIFEAFAQEDSSSTRRFGGTGLGLTIAKHLSKIMGGTVEVESKMGAGSTFRFTARLEKQAEPVKNVASNVKETDSVADDPCPVSPPLLPVQTFTGNILLVDDNPMNQQLVRTMIQRFGCTVEVANNGREAVDVLAEKFFDLVLMDCQMPIMDGFEATHLIRAREAAEGECGKKTVHTNVIALTAHAMEDDRKQCLAHGMDDYLSKPFTLEELENVLRRWLLGEKKAEKEKEKQCDKKQEGEIESASLDRKALDRIASIQPGLLNKVVSIYLKSSTGFIEAIRSAAASGDTTVLMKASHSLKSASTNIGAIMLADLCKELEMKGKTNNTEEVLQIVDTLKAEYERVRVALKFELEQRK
jgi:PAS domain S-box-containing protein